MKKRPTKRAQKPAHAHACSCEHKAVQFCADCKVVHCLACKQEWSQTPYQLSHYSPWLSQTIPTLPTFPTVTFTADATEPPHAATGFNVHEHDAPPLTLTVAGRPCLH